MRKYRQALIWTLLVIGVTGLILYRNEYIKLKETFILFDVLKGDSGFNVKNCLVLNETKDGEKRPTLAYPFPIWNSIGSNFMFYSAFSDTDENGRVTTKAIGFGSPADSINFHCHIWYDYKDVIISTNGKFKYTTERIEQTEKNYFEFICEELETDVKGKPYMLVLIDVTDGRKYFVPIFRNVLKPMKGSSAICVHPDVTGIGKSSIVEFLSFHEIAGFTDILIYDFGLHYGVLKKVEEIVSASGSFRSFSILNWNFPVANSLESKFLFKKDCLYRTSNQADSVVALNWGQYLVPEDGLDQSSIFYNYTSLVNTRVDFVSKICCTDKRDTKGSEKSWPKVLKKTECAPFDRDNFIVMNPKRKRLAISEKLIVKKGSINTYDSCYNVSPNRIIFNPWPSEYLGKLMASKILRLWKSGTFFT